jgi:hypothetical protein
MGMVRDGFHEAGAGYLESNHIRRHIRSTSPDSVRVAAGRFTIPALVLTALLLGSVPAGAQRTAAGGKPGTPAKAPVRGNPGPAPAGQRLTASAITGVLRGLGYQPRPYGPYQRIQVDEPNYGYAIDVGLSASGDWLVCLASLAPVPDLTKIPSGPLLALLSRNDALLGMSFSYNAENARVMLNAAVPNRLLDPPSLRNLIEGIKKTVRSTEGLWNPQQW